LGAVSDFLFSDTQAKGEGVNELRIANFEFRILFGGTTSVRLEAEAMRLFTTSSTFKVRQAKSEIRNPKSEI
jgi:hypothetical protein